MKLGILLVMNAKAAEKRSTLLIVLSTIVLTLIVALAESDLRAPRSVRPCLPRDFAPVRPDTVMQQDGGGIRRQI